MLKSANVMVVSNLLLPIQIDPGLYKSRIALSDDSRVDELIGFCQDVFGP
jgi:hypothetical protein